MCDVFSDSLDMRCVWAILEKIFSPQLGILKLREKFSHFALQLTMNSFASYQDSLYRIAPAFELAGVMPHDRFPLLLGHCILAQVKRLADRYPVLRGFITIGIFIAIRRSH